MEEAGRGSQEQSGACGSGLLLCAPGEQWRRWLPTRSPRHSTACRLACFPATCYSVCTWTSSNIVACSWLVRVVRCFWSSNLVLDEFIPVEKREKDKGLWGKEAWVGFTTFQTHFLQGLSRPLQDASIWQQHHCAWKAAVWGAALQDWARLSQNSQTIPSECDTLHISYAGRPRTQEFYKASSNTTLVYSASGARSSTILFGIKILKRTQTFSFTMTHSSNYKRMWKHS